MVDQGSKSTWEMGLGITGDVDGITGDRERFLSAWLTTLQSTPQENFRGVWVFIEVDPAVHYRDDL